jgi:uncharacterized membrane protein YesL
MDIEKQKKSFRQARVVAAVFLTLSLLMLVEVYTYPGIFNDNGLLVITFWSIISLFFAVPITVFYVILTLLRFFRLRKMEGQD